MRNGPIRRWRQWRVHDAERARAQALARLILALADRRREEVVRLFREMGYRTARENDDNAYTAAVIAFDRDDREITRGLNIQARALPPSLSRM